MGVGLGFWGSGDGECSLVFRRLTNLPQAKVRAALVYIEEGLDFFHMPFHSVVESKRWSVIPRHLDNKALEMQKDHIRLELGPVLLSLICLDGLDWRAVVLTLLLPLSTATALAGDG